MYTSQAKKLKVGDRVLWSRGNEPEMHGTIAKKKYNTIHIEWDGNPAGIRTTWFADCMDHIFTQAQLDQIEKEKNVAEVVKRVNRERLKTHNYDGTKRE